VWEILVGFPHHITLNYEIECFDNYLRRILSLWWFRRTMISKLRVILFTSISPSDTANWSFVNWWIYFHHTCLCPSIMHRSLYQVSRLQHATLAFRDNSRARHVDLTKKGKPLIPHGKIFRINCFLLNYEGPSVAECIQVIINRW
jgi:hypothetical protein